jgi:hypothetical protein
MSHRRSRARASIRFAPSISETNLEVKPMSHGISRRQLIQRAVAVSALLPALNGVAKAASQVEGLTPLDVKDSVASALGFVTEVSNASANPTYKKGQHCGSCVHYLGSPSDAVAGCNIYIGRSVPANGWCTAWSVRPG